MILVMDFEVNIAYNADVSTSLDMTMAKSKDIGEWINEGHL